MKDDRSPYRTDARQELEPRPRLDRERIAVGVSALALAGLPLFQLATTGDASQTDLGVSVLLVAFIASWSIEARRRRPTSSPRR